MVCGQSQCLACIAYHLGADWIPGGLLGVGVFFTLSGYLITDLLLAQLQRRGRIDLPGFWLARARRLLPALVVLLIVVMAWVTVIGPHQPLGLPRVRRQRALLLPELVADLPRRLLLRAVRVAGAAQPPLVAVGRGTVLHPLAVPPADRAEARSRAPHGLWDPPAPGPGDAGGGADLGRADGGPVPLGSRPVPGLLRDGHPRAGAADRRGAGDGLAEPDAARGDPRGSATAARRWRRPRPARDRADVLALRRVLAVPLPRRVPAALDRDRARRRGDGAPGGTARAGPWDASPCAGSASAPTASTSGTSRSSSSPPPPARTPPDLLRALLQLAATFVDRRALVEVRRGPDPPRGAAAPARARSA